MTDLYGPEGQLDYAAAAKAIRDARGITNPQARAAEFELVTAAALVDIAWGLGMLTHNLIIIGESMGAYDGREVGPDGEPMGDPERETDEEGYDLDTPDTQLDIGDLVTLEGMGAGAIRALGQSEGDDWAEVAWDVDEGEDERVTRVWVSTLTPEGVAEQGEPEPSIDETPAAAEPRDLIDDIDSDFDIDVPFDPQPTKAKSKGKGK